MNKQYQVDEEGNVRVIKENNEIINYGKYNKHTKEILSLENYSEEIQEKLAEEADKQFEKELKKQAKLNEKRDYSASAERLNDSINDLIGKTKK